MNNLKKSAVDLNQEDLVKTIERKTSTIVAMEQQMHAMEYKEKLRRRQSISRMLNFRSTEEVEKEELEKKQLIEELTSVKEELERVKGKREAEALKYRKMAERYKIELTEKTDTISKLNELVVDLRGQIRVAVRVREYDREQEIFTVISDNDIRFGQNTFHFEHLFRPDITQAMLFDEIQELIQCALNGRNVCLIAYGPTGSGKTFTMRGDATGGVIPNAIRLLLSVNDAKSEILAVGWKYRFSASFIEVYNEEVFDLLNERKKLEVKTAAFTTVVGLRKLPIEKIEDVNALLQLADSQRSTASTACNSESSRSHAIFQVYVEGQRDSGESVQCCLSLVDLAGSERAKESGAQGKQFTELKNINKSLTTLKMCIRAQMTKSAHVPYRDSKLTVLLREFLGAGSSKTMFIAHVNPKDVSETKRTLEFTAELRSTSLGKAIVQTGQK